MTDWDKLKAKWDKENAEWKRKERLHDTIIRSAAAPPYSVKLAEAAKSKTPTKPHRPVKRAAPIMAKRNQQTRPSYPQPKVAAETKPAEAKPKLFDKLRNIENQKQEAMKKYMALEREANKLVDDI